MSLLHSPTFYPFPFFWGRTRVAIFQRHQFIEWLSLYEPFFRRTTKLSAKAFPFKSHYIKFRGLVDNFTLKMTSWKKTSAAVGLSGLTPREAVRGALTCPKFQNMPDPLDKDLFGPVIVKAEVRNIFYRVLLFFCRTCRHIR